MIAKKNWMLVTMASLGLAVAVPSFAQDAKTAEPKREEVRLNQLPDPAARAIRDAAAGNKVVVIYSITEGNETFYRARITDKGSDKWVQVGREGRLQEIQDADGRVRTRLATIPEEARKSIDREAKDQKVTEVYAITRGNETFYQAHISTRNGERIVQVGKEGRVQDVTKTAGKAPVLASERGDAREGRRRLSDRDQRSFEGWKREKVDPDRLPGPVKQALGANDVKLNQLSEAWVNTRDGKTVYSVVEASPTREILHRVNANGKILGKDNVTEQGRERVEFERLPGTVKGTLQKHGNPNDYTRIWAVTEGNETFFIARHRNGEVYRVGREGAMMDD